MKRLIRTVFYISWHPAVCLMVAWKAVFDVIFIAGFSAVVLCDPSDSATAEHVQQSNTVRPATDSW